MTGDLRQFENEKWGDLVEEYHARIFAFCWHLLASRPDAEDATQEAFMKAYRSRDVLLKSESIKSWLYTIARNVCMDRKRWWRRFRLHQEANPPGEGIAQESGVSIELRQLIDALPARQKEVFILRHWHGFSTEETARLLGLSDGTVKSHLTRAISRLKSEILEANLYPESSREQKTREEAR